MTEFDRQETLEKADAALEMETAVPNPGPESVPTGRETWIMPILGGLIILFDQFTKYMVEGTMPLYTAWAPWPELARFFQFTHVPNTGTAFGLFPNGSGFFTVMAILVSLAIIYYNYTLPGDQRLLRVALGLQLGGAIGNLIDRLRLGHVTDFFDFGAWPIFNIADTSIVTGAFILAWLVWQEAREEQRQTAAAAADASADVEPAEPPAPPTEPRRFEDAEA